MSALIALFLRFFTAVSVAVVRDALPYDVITTNYKPVLPGTRQGRRPGNFVSLFRLVSLTHLPPLTLQLSNHFLHFLAQHGVTLQRVRKKKA